MNELCVTFPKSLEAAINKSESEVVVTIKEIVATELYKRGEISLGKAAEIMGISKRDMLHHLSVKKIPISYDIEDLESDLKTLDRVLG
jgi:predicted HTH domain antitoxin